MAGTSGQRIRSAQQSLTESFAKVQDEDIFLAFTGRGDTNKTVLVYDRPGYIYARVPKKVETGTLEEYSEIQVFSPEEQRHGVPIQVTRSKDNPSRYESIGVWPTGMGQSLVQTTIASVPPHHWAHELFSIAGGHDPVRLDTLQLRNMSVRPTSPPSSKVLIDAGWYIWKDRNVHWYDGDEVDLAGSIPTGTLPFMPIGVVSLWLDPDTQTVVENLKIVGDTAAFDIRDHIEWPAEDYIPLGAVRLVSNDYTIDWSTDKNPNFVDMRPHVTLMPGDWLPAGHPLDPDGGYHTGTLDDEHVAVSNPRFDSGTLEGVLDELWYWSYLRVLEQDGAPNVFPVREVRVTNGTLTDLGGGTVQLETGGTGAGDVVVTTDTFHIRTELYDAALSVAGRFDVDLTAIAGYDTYDYLEILLTHGRTSVAAVSDIVYVLFNSDTTAANYDHAMTYVSSLGGPAQLAAATPLSGYVAGNTATADEEGVVHALLHNYTASDKEKLVAVISHMAYNNGSVFHVNGVMRWHNNNAITRITVQPDGYAVDSFAIGTRLQIFGHKEETVVVSVTGGGSGTYDTVEDDYVEVLVDGKILNFTKNLIAVDVGSGRANISGTLDIEEDDVHVADAAILNFEGGGGKVTDEGGGKVTVDITGGAGGGTGTFRELQEDDVTVLRDGQYINFEDDDAFLRLDVIDEGGGKGTISGSFDESLLDNRFYREDEFIDTSAGVADAGKPIKLDASGLLPASMTHLTVTEIDGVPSVDNVIRIRVSNGTLTNDGGGQVTVVTGGGAGGDDDSARYMGWRGLP